MVAWNQKHLFSKSKKNPSFQFLFEKKKIRLSASSSLMGSKKRPWLYQLKHLVDQNKKTAWCEGDVRNGVGEWIKFDFGTPTYVENFSYQNGYQVSSRVYSNNHRLRLVNVFLDNENPFSQEINEKKGTIPIHKKVKTVKIQVKKVVLGQKYEDLCITSLLPQG